MGHQAMPRRATVTAVVLPILVIALLGITLSGCDEDDVEKMLGGSTAAAIESTYGVNNDPLLVEWLDDMGQTMVSFSTRQHIPYSFKILETDMVNAFAGPWGHVYVTEGLLEFADSEEEVATVVGHEIGHVVNRDIIKSFKKNILFGIGVSVISDKSETLGTIAGIGTGLLSLRYSRKDEYDADDSGRFLSYRAGYNPGSQVHFLQHLMDEKGRRSPSYIEVLLSTHPPTDRRINRQVQMAENDPQNPDALVQIGQGYMRRAQYATALGYFQKAAELKPEAEYIEVAAADALAACGGDKQAVEKYQIILASRHNNLYAQQQLGLVQAKPPVVVVAITPEQANQARDYLPEAHLTALAAGTAAAQAETFAEQFGGRIRPMALRNSQISNELIGLSDRYPEIDDAIKDAVLEANAAIGKTAEVVYSLEAIAPLVSSAACGLSEVSEQLEEQLAQLAAGKGEAGHLAVIKRSVADIKAAMADLAGAQNEALGLTASADQIQWRANENLTAMKSLLACDEKEDRGWRSVLLSQLASSTQQHAEQVLAACRKCHKPVRRAQLRKLVVQANIAGMAAPPAQRAALDELVAYHMRGNSGDVGVLRNEGMGYGEAAYVLAISDSSHRAPVQLLGGTASTRSVVDQLCQFSTSDYGPRIMMKFLVHSMQEEVVNASPLDL